MATKKRKPGRPRIGTRNVKRASSASGRAPTKRLVKRRTVNSKKGYFPNPNDIARAHRAVRARKAVKRAPAADPMFSLVGANSGKCYGKFNAKYMTIADVKKAAVSIARRHGEPVAIKR